MEIARLAKRSLRSEKAFHELVETLRKLGASKEDIKLVKETRERYRKNPVTGDEWALAALVLGIVDRIRGEDRDPDEVWELVRD